jgi:hypothetical protein
MQHCWELKGSQLVAVDDPCTGDGNLDGNLDALIAAAGYCTEVSSTSLGDVAGAEVTLYKNVSNTPGKPLFYLDVMGMSTGIGALVAHDFRQLVETLNYLSGLLKLLAMGQASGEGELTRYALQNRP